MTANIIHCGDVHTPRDKQIVSCPCPLILCNGRYGLYGAARWIRTSSSQQECDDFHQLIASGMKCTDSQVTAFGSSLYRFTGQDECYMKHHSNTYLLLGGFCLLLKCLLTANAKGHPMWEESKKEQFQLKRTRISSEAMEYFARSAMVYLPVAPRCTVK